MHASVCMHILKGDVMIWWKRLRQAWSGGVVVEVDARYREKIPDIYLELAKKLGLDEKNTKHEFINACLGVEDNEYVLRMNEEDRSLTIHKAAVALEYLLP